MPSSLSSKALLVSLAVPSTRGLLAIMPTTMVLFSISISPLCVSLMSEASARSRSMDVGSIVQSTPLSFMALSALITFWLSRTSTLSRMGPSRSQMSVVGALPSWSNSAVVTFRLSFALKELSRFATLSFILSRLISTPESERVPICVLRASAASDAVSLMPSASLRLSADTPASPSGPSYMVASISALPANMSR